jgi:HEAT repeat protein
LSKPKLEDIAVLGNLLNFKQVQFRRLASSALRASSNEAAIPLLITALGDVDSEVRYNAVMGLAEMFDDSKHAPSYKYFLENQDYYIDYWKAKMARQS